MISHNLLFSMDIGTRTVVGIVGYHDGEKFKILAHEVMAHKERAMYDGQVHDIELVAKAVRRVKEKLEKKLDIKLSRVCVAAAGRTLKTCKAFIEREIEPNTEVDKEMVSSLEIEGVQLAQNEIDYANGEDDNGYYSVGYAVVNYYINGGIIGNPIGQKGKKLGVDILATFLPRVVVDSLYSVVKRADLEVESLTLEPIAAVNVSIQNNLKLLNIALVDIGAGTSDIALTKNGTVYAFAMVPTAGDEITERLAEKYLLDFDTAEGIKVNLNNKSLQKFKDIMEIDYEVESKEIVEVLKPAIKDLAQEICEKILEYNGKAPSAVFLVGGGSQIPLLTDFIADILLIPIERVGIKKTNIIKDVEIKGKKLAGPEFITPIGIAVNAHLNRQKDFIQVSVNEKPVKLLNSKTLTIADALTASGFNPRKLIGRRGDALKFKLNGKEEIVKGESGETARIYVNTMEASLDCVISNGDRILVESAIDGKNAKAYVKDYIRSSLYFSYCINGELHNTIPTVMINSKEADLDDEIKENDEVFIIDKSNLKDIITKLGLEAENYDFFINGEKAHEDHEVLKGDEIEYISKNLAKKAVQYKEVAISLNGRPIKIKENKSSIIFVDIFNYIDFDYKTIKGNLMMLLNGKKANFTDILCNGDEVTVKVE